MLFRTTFLILFYLVACNADTDALKGLGLDAENDADDDAEFYNVVNNGMGIEVKAESTDDDADFFKSESGLVLAVDGDGSNVQVVVYEGPTECTDEDKILSGNYISIHFDGYIDESSDVGDRGTRFISSRDMNNNKTVDFQIGKKRVIEGWEKGLLGLCKGSSAMLVIPPDLVVYGEMEGGPGLPSGATLLFNIEVIETSKSFRASTDPSMDSLYCSEDAEDGSLSNQECSASSSMLSLAFEEEEDIGVATSFSVSARSKRGGKYNKRLKKKSKKKVQEYITYLTSPVWCNNKGYKRRVEPTKKNSFKCNSSCFAWCDRCCSGDCQYEGGFFGTVGSCYCPSVGAYCPSGYSTQGSYQECHRCVMNPSKPPGSLSVGAEGAVSSGVTAQTNGCPQGYLCNDATVWCARKCDQYGTTFPQHCSIYGTNYCAKSQEICNDKLWEFFKIWGEFLLNFIPGGGQTVKGIAKAAQASKNFRQLNRALRKVGRNAVKKMKKDFQKEIRTLKKDLKNALKEEAESVIDGVIDDALEEMSLKASKDDQDTDELGDIVLKALGEFVTDLFSPFDFKGLKALMAGAQCGSYSISGTDLEWEDLPDGLENVALRKPARQSSTPSLEAHAGLAVDGNLDGDYHAGSVTHTYKQRNPWWEVDLKKLYTIEYIHVYNREDCCKDRLAGFNVSIYNGNTLKFSKTMPRNKTPDYETIIEVPKVQGNKVKVSIPEIPGRTEHLTLTEVEVIGKPS